MSLRPDSVRDTASGFSLDQYFNAEASLPPPNALSDSSRIVLANSAMSGSVVKKKEAGVGSGFKFDIFPQSFDGKSGNVVVSSEAVANSSCAKNLSFTIPSGMKKEWIDTNSALNSKRVEMELNKSTSNDMLKMRSLLEETRNKLDRMQTKLLASETSVRCANEKLLSEREATKTYVAQIAEKIRVQNELEKKLKDDLHASTLSLKKSRDEHEELRLKMQTECSAKIANENECLQKSLIESQTNLFKAQNSIRTLTIANEALKSSNEDVSVQLGKAVAKHESDMAMMNERCTAVDLHADFEARVAREVKKIRETSQKEMEEKVSNAVEETRCAVQLEMNTRLESARNKTEENEAAALKRMESLKCDLEAALNDVKLYKTRLDDVQGSTQTDIPSACEAAVEETTNADFDKQNRDAVQRYDCLQRTLDHHVDALKSDPHCVRKQMKISAISRQCKQMYESFVFGDAVSSSKLIATADHDTSQTNCDVSWVVKDKNIKGRNTMITKAYCTADLSFFTGNTGEVLNSSWTCGDETNGIMSRQNADTSNNVERLIKATQEDLTNALKYYTLVHKQKAGFVGEIKVDSTGRSTACVVSQNGNMEEDVKEDEHVQNKNDTCVDLISF